MWLIHCNYSTQKVATGKMAYTKLLLSGISKWTNKLVKYLYIMFETTHEKENMFHEKVTSL